MATMMKREIKVQDVKVGMKIKFDGLHVVGGDTDAGYTDADEYGGEVSAIQIDGQQVFVTFMLPLSTGSVFASLEAEHDDIVWEVRAMGAKRTKASL